ncbi:MULTISPECIES: hypothetical protein [unclassified Treponema]|uniref:hypothetical protein n=1 Tax=unclassified Treponema TaxID=2638727 RepID=UPI0020A2C7DD|nr:MULTISPECIES: hypothetical protein [unclassified Treponema]UTC67202.1 hypothetical protein E4O06_00570 [Treponema sp. OMZ 789]UTC69931.1 hypothetical protein E4O01_00565 [Treponema sp. OMZ 790]UTC72646.1 hypothetical protein E4O02_00565 [Treponema sp. OMZ 791]
MKKLLNNGFQPVSETEMMMVEGGYRNASAACGKGFDVPSFSGKKKIDQYDQLKNENTDEPYMSPEVRLTMFIMEFQRKSGGSSGRLDMCISSLNDYF